ncbi:MAG: monofunctional biosynthetic peptidoglycan transglycosylase, partial [Alphaproteobacteria bacterium]
AALLAAVLPNPRRFDAGNPSGYVVKRAGVISRRTLQLGELLDCALPNARG